MLQVFESLSKICNMLPQRNVALKDALCAKLDDIDYVGDITFKQRRHQLNFVQLHGQKREFQSTFVIITW